ncbi:MAG: DUF5916 domain-containing protein [Ignavibacteriaceae bacterium]
MAVVLISLLITFTASAQLSEKQEKKLYLKETVSSIEVDGVIDNAWNKADSTSDFFQLQPYFNQPPSCITVVKVLTTEDALYCLFISYQTLENVQASAGLLDDFTGDGVSIMLDTFNDKQTAYKFAVSASGVKMDSRMLDDARNKDYGWDGIWFADSEIYNWGYVVEIKIPYKSIKYNKELTEWGLDFDRWMPVNGEDLYWCEYEQNEGQRISKFGKLVFSGFKPSAEGLNLEIYPVGITNATRLHNNKYDIKPDWGLDVFYNPSLKLTFQLTANPDFAQIEADPFDFNITKYETYFPERRPFFTEGSEIFLPSGRQQSTGFYKPLELFYSRRIGKSLPDGQIVPLIYGAKAFGRINEWDYGGFITLTDEIDFIEDDKRQTEPKALFVSGRAKKRILTNSSVGFLVVGKQTKDNTFGVIDVDGAFRESDWQLAYQLARSFENFKGDYAASAGFTMNSTNWLSYARLRAVGKNFNVKEVGFVPWKGTAEFVSINGPIWYFNEGYINKILLYAGPYISYEDVDSYSDHGMLVGFNMQLRDNWGYEINFSLAKSKDEKVIYTSYDATFSSWYNISPKWNGNLFGGYARTYNFSRGYVAFHSRLGAFISWRAFNFLELGSSYEMFIEGNPDGKIQAITYNARPYFSFTPINNLNFRMYVDNVYLTESGKIGSVIIGFLFSWNFLPKSWVYLAINEFQDRSDEYDSFGNLLPNRIHVTERAAVLKLKYLYYF